MLQRFKECPYLEDIVGEVLSRPPEPEFVMEV